MKTKDFIDLEKMSKKYRLNVKKVINGWKKGLSDLELSTSLGIDFFTLKQLRYEIESAHLRRRYLKWVEGLEEGESKNAPLL